ncbi:MAG: glycosyltransferase [Sphingobacteriaceae bacterium]
MPLKNERPNQMNELPKASLIISVYKNVRDLKVVLDALAFQTEKRFEIIISEDGNSLEMKTFVENYQTEFKLTHLSQADIGWRKNQALNNAIRASSSPYLIFIDGDSVLHHRFIENHLRFASPKDILAGRRIKFGVKYSNKLRAMPLLKFEKSIFGNLYALLSDGVKFIEEGIYINPDGPFRFIANKRTVSWITGCNFSCYKDALVSINGFDEDYIKPAIGEDVDLTWRWIGLGYQIKSVRNYAVQYHLYHIENWTSQDENIAIMEEKKARNAFRCENGLEK